MYQKLNFCNRFGIINLSLVVFILMANGLPFVSAQKIDYYQSIDDNATGLELKQQLQSLITETHHTTLTFTPGVWQALKRSDVDLSNPSHVLLIYGFQNDDIPSTDRTRHIDSSCHVSSCIGLWVREHVYPRSLGTPNLGTTGAGADLHALRAIDDQRNNLRGNRAFGEGLGNSTVLPNGAFYPGDEWKGDVARMMMYMHLRYPTQCPIQRVGGGTLFSFDWDTIPEIFLNWNAEDPPSDHELFRNEVIYELQGNRNPFIDNPALATSLWGGPQAYDAWNISSMITDSIQPTVYIYPSLAHDFIYVNTSYIVAPFYYQILDTSGRIFLSSYSWESQINVQGLQNGFYYLRVISGRQNHHFRFIKK